MKIFYLLIIYVHGIIGKAPIDKEEFCKNLQCDENEDERVCGIRYESDTVIFKLFDNECKLLIYGCNVDDDKTYGITDLKHCSSLINIHSDNTEHVKFIDDCFDCSEVIGERVCGIRSDGDGFRIRTFDNECQLHLYNCKEGLQFNITDNFICSNDPEIQNSDEKIHEIADEKPTETPIETASETPEVTGFHKFIKNKTLVVVDGTMLDRQNINVSIANFFAATHVFDLPVQDVYSSLNHSTRKRLLPIFGPIKVFTPWIRIPKNITDDYYHTPTLSSCYHKCPTKCPDTYAPVCGVPGIIAREPSLVFQNHCYMDVAQCKMYWEDKSDTAQSSSYIESSFMFCLGDELHGLYRFLPLVRTLQHMGRLKLKGHFRYKLRNMRFFNNLLSREPKIMG